MAGRLARQYLVYTNVWLERLLDQERSEEVGSFLAHTRSDRLLVTDFAFHSIAIALSRLKKNGILLAFVQDAFVDGHVGLVRLRPEDTARVLAVAESWGLDFDDAYHHVAAENRGLRLISFDTDFDRTDRSRAASGEVVRRS